MNGHVGSFAERRLSLSLHPQAASPLPALSGHSGTFPQLITRRV